MAKARTPTVGLFLLLLAALVGALPLQAAPGAGPPPTAPAAAAVPAGTAPDTVWQYVRVDAPKQFRHMAQDSLALDSVGHPHIAYGEDFLYYAWHDGAAWHLETVDDAGRVGQSASLALDSAGRPHILYCQVDPSRYDCDVLRYAYFDGQRWQIEVVDVDLGQWFGAHSSLALDANDRPHVSYYQNMGFLLKYAHRDGAGWHIEIVDDNPGYGSSLALDSQGYPHIAYYTLHLKYAYYDGATWHVARIAEYTGANPSLALDALDRRHISYYNDDDGGLYYAYYDGAGWTFTLVDGEPSSGGDDSLALDAAGRPHISYLANWTLRYAYSDGTNWHIEVVDPAANTGRYNSLALDAQDHPHISFRSTDDLLRGHLQYAYHDGTSWHIVEVDQDGYAGWNPSLSLDGAGRPHLSYWRNQELAYNRYDGTQWQRETVDQARYFVFAALALDSLEQPHISYYNQDTCLLLYGHDDGAGWITETVDSGGGIDWSCRSASLALDAADRPHISYFYDLAGDDGELRYAYRDASGWLTATLDVGRYTGRSSALALDAAGRPHILYYNGDYPSPGARHTWYDGSVWQVETVTDGSTEAFSLIITPDGRLHASYYTAAGLWYAWNDGTGWQAELVDAADGGQASLALDAADRPHIGYCIYSAYPPYYVCEELRYAHYDGTAWQIEVADGSGGAGNCPSLALDAAGRPHIGYFDESNRDLKYATACIPIEGATIQGPDRLPAGISGWFTATRTPFTATFPLYTWDNGTTGPTAAYSWTTLGIHTATVTATNACSAAPGTHAVEVFCEPVAAVAAAGPAVLPAGIAGWYTATYTPLTASLPLTYTWDNGTVGPGAVYSWTVTGTHTLVVTGTNLCSATPGTLTVTVFCQPVAAVAISGPPTLPLGRVGLYSATYAPLTTSLPLTLTWDNGAVGPTAAYVWSTTGPHTVTVTATNSCSQDRAAFPVLVTCAPVESVQVQGPFALLTGETGRYTATYAPPTATLSVTFTWDNGATGPTAAYSWTLPGVYTLTVTATNACSTVSASHSVTVLQPVTGVVVAGPLFLLVGETGHYTATYLPPTATLPVTITWDNGRTTKSCAFGDTACDFSFAEIAGTVGPTAVYSWTMPGVYTVTVTATNACGEASARESVTVRGYHRIYLPLVWKIGLFSW